MVGNPVIGTLQCFEDEFINRGAYLAPRSFVGLYCLSNSRSLTFCSLSLSTQKTILSCDFIADTGFSNFLFSSERLFAYALIR